MTTRRLLWLTVWVWLLARVALAQPVQPAAPPTVPYWVGAANVTLTAEKNLGALGVGLVRNDPAGTPAIYGGTSCTNQFVRTLNASGAATCAAVALATDVSGILPYASGGTNASTAWTAGSILFAGASALAQDNDTFFWNTTTKTLSIGTPTPPLRLGQTFAVATSANFGGSSLSTWSITPIEAAVIDFNRSRSATIGTHSVVSNNDVLGYLAFRGSDGAKFVDAVFIEVNSDGVPSLDNMPGRITFATTPAGGAGGISRVTIKANGWVGVNTTLPDALFHIANGELLVTQNQIRVRNTNAGIDTTMSNTNAEGGFANIGTGTVHNLYLITGNARRFGLNTSGNAALGTTAFPTAGTSGLVFGDGTVLSGMGTNTAGLYAEDVLGTVELFGIDEAGNKLQLTPHNYLLFSPDAAEPYPWSYYSRNDYLGIEIGVDLARLARLVQTLTGQQLIYTRPTATRRDWVEDQETQMRRAMATYEAWELLADTPGQPRGPAPSAPVVKTPPDWLRTRLANKSWLNTTRAQALRAELCTWRTARGIACQ